MSAILFRVDCKFLCFIYYLSIFFNKKCQEVDTVSNFVFLGVPNLISEDTDEETVDEVLQKLEDELIHDDKDYKLTVRQKEHWIKNAITKEYPGGMPWALGGSSEKEEEATSSKQLSSGLCFPRSSPR